MDTRKIGFTALGTAIYTRLTGHPQTDSFRVFNHVPVEDKSKNITMPYVVYGTPTGIRSASFTTRDTNAEDNTMQIDVWSRAKGDKEVGDMMNKICQAIFSSGLNIEGYDMPYLALLQIATIVKDNSESSDIVYHGVLLLKFDMAQE